MTSIQKTIAAVKNNGYGIQFHCLFFGIDWKVNYYFTSLTHLIFNTHTELEIS